MATDAINTGAALVYEYPELTVLLGGTDGSPPGDTETFDSVYCMRVVQSAGGSRLDYADLTYSLADSLENRTQPSGFSRMVSVRLPDGALTQIHLGDYISESFSISQDNETLTAQSQVRGYHFGSAVVGYDVWSPLSAAEEVIESQIVFNPTIDDVTLFNMSSKIRTGAAGRLWTHPETSQNTLSELYQEVDREEWVLRRAIVSLCELLNADEEFIRNPSYADLVDLADAPSLRDVVIPIGARLPESLDILLIPHGYNWYVDYDVTPQSPKITIFKKGEGDEKTLFLQAPGESLNLEWSNTNQLSVANAIGDSFNQVRVLGQFEEVEVTIPLFPAWKEEHDSLTAADLDKDGTEYLGKETVHRLWIANEAGDLGNDQVRWGMTLAVPDLSLIFETWTPHKRVLGEPISYLGGDSDDGGKQRRPIYVEYSADAGATWVACPTEWSIKLCPDQIGVLFDADKPPEELVDAGEDARVRVTGTVFGDKRVEGFAEKQAHAVNGRTYEIVLNMPDKFQSRWRQTIGDYKSVFAEATANYDPVVDADERDDTEEILAYAEALRDQNHYAEVDCEFRLPGWHLEYKIGDLISKVEGRELSLDAAPATAPDARYVQVVERRFENGDGGPSTVLIVDRGIDENAANRIIPGTKTQTRNRA